MNLLQYYRLFDWPEKKEEEGEKGKVNELTDKYNINLSKIVHTRLLLLTSHLIVVYAYNLCVRF